MDRGNFGPLGFGGHQGGRGPGGPMGHRPPRGGGLLNGLLNGTLNSASAAIGASVGAALGSAAQKVTNQAVQNVTTDMEIANEEKKMALDKEKKISNLPTNCPHCGAPTKDALVCEYCGCKIVE